MDPSSLRMEAFRDQAKMIELVARDAKRLFRGRAAPAELECWARDAVAGLWCDDIRVATFVPSLALREVGERVAEAERGRATAGTAVAA